MINLSSIAFQCCVKEKKRRFGNLRYKMGLLMLVIWVNLVLVSCKETTSSNYDEARINEVLYNIESAYNDHDIDALLLNFSPDFRHDGQNLWEIREMWLDRMAEFSLIDFQDIEIDIHGDLATVSFRMKLISQTQTLYSDEPATHGDLSYFVYEDSDWSILGNQQDSRGK